jgi:hypothetical protein
VVVPAVLSETVFMRKESLTATHRMAQCDRSTSRYKQHRITHVDTHMSMILVAGLLKCTAMSAIDMIRSPGGFFMANTCILVPKPEHDHTSILYAANEIPGHLEQYLEVKCDRSNNHASK